MPLVGAHRFARRRETDPSRRGVAADDRCGVVALVAEYSRGFDLEDARAFLGDGGEDSLGACLGGDEGGDAPQRALLLCEPADLRELRLRIALEGAFVVDTRIARAELDAGGDESVDVGFSPTMSRFDQAISLRSPSFVSQCPTCGLGGPVFHT